MIWSGLINIIGGLIHEQILGHVRVPGSALEIADEVTNSANKEQLSLVLHYLDPETDGVC